MFSYVVGLFPFNLSFGSFWLFSYKICLLIYYVLASIIVIDFPALAWVLQVLILFLSYSPSWFSSSAPILMPTSMFKSCNILKRDPLTNFLFIGIFSFLALKFACDFYFNSELYHESCLPDCLPDLLPDFVVIVQP